MFLIALIQNDLTFFFLIFSKSFPNNFSINPVGVTIKKKIKNIIIGGIILFNNIPNLNHILFNGVKITEFNKPKIKKANEIIILQILTS